jgi:anti-sigma regulatory factor (Ser/Thr protein kinase)
MVEVGRALDFELSTLRDVRQRVDDVAARYGVDSDRRAGLVLAVSELATNAIRYGGGRGSLRCWVDDHRLIAEIADAGQMPELALAVARPARGAQSGYGLWLVTQMTDRVAISSSDAGTAVRVEVAR